MENSTGNAARESCCILQSKAFQGGPPGPERGGDKVQPPLATHHIAEVAKEVTFWYNQGVTLCLLPVNLRGDPKRKVDVCRDPNRGPGSTNQAETVFQEPIWFPGIQTISRADRNWDLCPGHPIAHWEAPKSLGTLRIFSHCLSRPHPA